jgi:hypothetical protein
MSPTVTEVVPTQTQYRGWWTRNLIGQRAILRFTVVDQGRGGTLKRLYPVTVDPGRCQGHRLNRGSAQAVVRTATRSPTVGAQVRPDRTLGPITFWWFPRLSSQLS